jgi:hypothetical protein
LHAARNLQPEGALHDRDFRSSVILSRQNLDAFVIDLTLWHARPGAPQAPAAARYICVRCARFW